MIPPTLVAATQGRYAVHKGFFNAHDHVELNHYPRSKFRDIYPNAHEWGEDMSQRLTQSPYREGQQFPLADRCFIGGLKNMLCGVTLVVHHNPPHKCLFARSFPVQVLRRYGWSHSLHFETEAQIVASYQRTPADGLWFIHLAEGTDAVAQAEYQCLKALGCIGKNTVLIHGVGLTPDDIPDAAPKIRALVTCPTTNQYLLGQTANLRLWQACGGTLWLGSDSRLTADGDWLDELHLVESLLPADCWRSCRLGGSESSYIVTHPNPVRRADIALVVKDGIPLIGEADLFAHFPNIVHVPAQLDGQSRRIHVDLARRIHACTLKERGLEVEPAPKRWWQVW